jgi:mannose-1-phosphate guanylyltransferase
LKVAENLWGQGTCSLVSSERFVDNLKKKAKEYIKNDYYYWNSGIFLWQLGIARTFTGKLPQIYQALMKIKRNSAKQIPKKFA